MSSPSPSRSSDRFAPLIVGREREQSALRQALDDMLGGHGSLALVGGEAGIGKTTLVEWLAAEAEAAGVLVLWGRSYDLTVTPPYGPWLEVLRRCHTLGDGFPPLPKFIGDADELAKVGNQNTLFAAVSDYVHRLAGSRPLMLVIDDLHWADQASVELLRYLSRQLDLQPLLLVGTYRSDELRRAHPLYTLLPLIVRETGATRLDLPPLDEAGRRALIQSRYALPVADQNRLEHYLDERAEGNPLFAGELLRTLEEERVLQTHRDSWSLGDLVGHKVPVLLKQLIEGRLARLGPAANLYLSQAAIIGQDVPLGLWATLASVPEAILLDIVELAIEARLVDPTEHGGRFAHALIREAIYEAVLPVRRNTWHRKVAEVLLAQPDPDPDLVAYHLQQADDARAMEWLIKAGERAERAYAWVTAAERFEAAASMMARDLSRGVARAVLLARAAVLQRYTDSQHSVSMLEEAHSVALEAQDAALTAYTLFQIGLLRCFTHDLGAGLQAMRAGVDALEALSSPDRERLNSLGLDAEVDNERGTYALWLAMSGRFREALEHGGRVIAAFPYPTSKGESLSAIPSDAYNAVASALAFLGLPAESLRRYRQGLQILKAKQHYAQVCWQASFALSDTIIPYLTDNLKLRQELARETTEAARKTGGVLPDWPFEHALVPLMALESRWSEVRDISQIFRSQANRVNFLLTSDPNIGSIARWQGDTDLAWSIVSGQVPAGASYVPEDDHLAEAPIAMRLAVDLCFDANDLDSARQWLEAHDRWLEWSGAVLGRAEGALLWARYDLLNGDSRAARRRAEAALRHASDPRQPLALIAVYRVLGDLDTIDKRFDDAERHLTESLTLADACAAPFERALTLLQFAELRLAQRRTGEATTLLDEVQAICEPLGAKPTLDRVARLFEQITASSMANKGAVLPAGLTRREAEVLRLVADGLSNREIADALFISERTAEHHVSNILSKLGHTTRAQAAVFAVEHRLLTNRSSSK